MTSKRTGVHRLVVFSGTFVKFSGATRYPGRKGLVKIVENLWDEEGVSCVQLWTG